MKSPETLTSQVSRATEPFPHWMLDRLSVRLSFSLFVQRLKEWEEAGGHEVKGRGNKGATCSPFHSICFESCHIIHLYLPQLYYRFFLIMCRSYTSHTAHRFTVTWHEPACQGCELKVLMWNNQSGFPWHYSVSLHRRKSVMETNSFLLWLAP